MDNRKYPLGLFVFGFISNILFRFFWLFVPALILFIVGIFVKPCLYVGLAALGLDILLSFIEQMMIRHAFLSESDNPDFRAFQDALSKDGNWKENLGDFIEGQMEDPLNTEVPKADCTEGEDKE